MLILDNNLQIKIIVENVIWYYKACVILGGVLDSDFKRLLWHKKNSINFKRFCKNVFTFKIFLKKF